MNLETIIETGVQLVRSHFSAIEKLVELAPRLEQLVTDVEQAVAGKPALPADKPAQVAASADKPAGEMPWGGSSGPGTAAGTAAGAAAGSEAAAGQAGSDAAQSETGQAPKPPWQEQQPQS